MLPSGRPPDASSLGQGAEASTVRRLRATRAGDCSPTPFRHFPKANATPRGRRVTSGREAADHFAAYEADSV